MKAILDYNGFTRMIEISDKYMTELYIPVIPNVTVGFYTGEVYLPEKLNRWVFRYDKHLTSDIIQYTFDREE